MWNWAEDKIRIKITWIRHGMTKSNEEHRYLGTTEEALSEKGIAQITESKKRYHLDQGGFLYTSPMLRCIQTAEILFDRDPVCIFDWKEMDFGRFEGKNYVELTGDPDYQRWIDSNGTLPFPGGESREAFIGRSMKGFCQMLTDLCEKADKRQSEYQVMAVVHGGTIMAVLSELTGMGYYDFQVKNGGAYETVLEIDALDRKVISIKKIEEG